MSTSAVSRNEKAADGLDPGDPAALLARTQDLSRRLHEREEFYRSILESLGEGVVITDRESRILYVNSRMECLTGYPRGELIGAISYELLTPKEEWPAMRRRLKDQLSGKEETYEHEHIRKDGQRHWVSVRALPYRNARGEIVGTIGLLSCIKDRKTLEFENEYLQEELRGNYRAILGDSPALKKVLAQIEMVAPTNAGVLILGESGTGKELVARAIHDRSPRKNAALVRVNCASVPRELFESEFFGHVRGAFTGAVKDRVGRFELAHGGTLFLDEIGEVPLELQSKLLRVLQEGQFEKVGEDRTRTVDVRIIAATNRDLEAEVKAGRFRQDLYYRLSVFPIELPPLRDRATFPPAVRAHARDDDSSPHARAREGTPVLRLARQCARVAECHRTRGYSFPQRPSQPRPRPIRQWHAPHATQSRRITKISPRLPARAQATGARLNPRRPRQDPRQNLRTRRRRRPAGRQTHNPVLKSPSHGVEEDCRLITIKGCLESLIRFSEADGGGPISALPTPDREPSRFAAHGQAQKH